MRDFPQIFVERDSKGGNGTVRRSRAGRVPLLQRVGFPDTLSSHWFQRLRCYPCSFIRYPTPISVWMYSGLAGFFSIFRRVEAITERSTCVSSP